LVIQVGYLAADAPEFAKIPRFLVPAIGPKLLDCPNMKNLFFVAQDSDSVDAALDLVANSSAFVQSHGFSPQRPEIVTKWRR
jgi:hypothetical protein